MRDAIHTLNSKIEIDGKKTERKKFANYYIRYLPQLMMNDE
jgi:hypothetical protein